MKFSEQWLRQWVDTAIPSQELIAQLSMAGHEVDGVSDVAAQFDHVVVGKIVGCEQHPDADRLRVCQVDVGNETLQIVCGGSNARRDIVVACALVGARIGSDFVIKKAKLRGVESAGMLCSAKELGLAESSEGILELPSDAPIGKSVREYLSLDDRAIEVDLTPNRGDCLSIAGIAREVAVINRAQFTPVKISENKVSSDATHRVVVSAPQACPRYVGRAITGLNLQTETPLYMREILRRAGLRSIDPIVDVTNFVMLELGQPMHAFDLHKLSGAIDVRMAQPGESLTLLNGQTIILTPNSLVIAHADGVLALAGVMGGEGSGVSATTTDVFLESAFFDPIAIAGRARAYGLHTDGSHRFERAVDPTLQRDAIERATSLLLEICGGHAGEIVEVASTEYLPKEKHITLRAQRVTQLLGIEIAREQIVDILQRLGMDVKTQGDDWLVTAPLRRSDIRIEADLIEEVARIYGYNNIPTHAPTGDLRMLNRSEKSQVVRDVIDVLVERGYHEVITYSFVDPKLQQLIDPRDDVMTLVNPISSELSQMRTQLWSGLIETLRYNQSRQQNDLKIVETGLRFQGQGDALKQEKVIAGLCAGKLFADQWAQAARDVDFFDVKSDLEALFALSGSPEEFRFEAQPHGAMHPGQGAKITRNGELLGWMGALHPRLTQVLDIKGPIFIFELQWAPLERAGLPRFTALSKFPAIRRDLAFLVNAAVSAQSIRDFVACNKRELIREVQVFDVYQGKGIEPGKKSIALGLTIQHASRTLTDTEVNTLLDDVVVGLGKSFDITLRE